MSIKFINKTKNPYTQLTRIIAMMMEAVSICETSVNCYETIWCSSPEVCYIHEISASQTLPSSSQIFFTASHWHWGHPQTPLQIKTLLISRQLTLKFCQLPTFKIKSKRGNKWRRSLKKKQEEEMWRSFSVMTNSWQSIHTINCKKSYQDTG
jgi:hypothetical protein